MTSTEAVNVAGAFYLPRDVRQIIRLLDDNPMPVADIALHIGSTLPATRAKLNRWKKAGFICIAAWRRYGKVMKPLYGLGHEDAPKSVSRIPAEMRGHPLIGVWGL